jgi:D-galacturonate reductase
MARALRGSVPGSPFDLEMATYPADGATDALAYRAALAALPRGSAVTIFTPDDTHFSIAMDCVAAGMHVLVTKPVVMTLAQHHALAAAAAAARVLVAVEVHKRWDPIYADARDRLRALGDFSQMHAYMSQPKLQLETFRAWAGTSSDISYYLNSHHVDFCEWVMAGGRGRPERVTALASTGVAERVLGRPCEDSITLAVEWVNLPSGAKGTATYTASWAAPKGDVHSQQRFFAMMQGGEVTVDQAHRGYSAATDAAGYASPNPLFMRYTPDGEGRFAGQLGYGYRSIEAFVRAAAACRDGAAPASFDESLATVHGTLQGTAILEAGRRSLDADGKAVRIVYATDGATEPVDLAFV